MFTHYSLYPFWVIKKQAKPFKFFLIITNISCNIPSGLQDFFLKQEYFKTTDYVKISSVLINSIYKRKSFA